MPKLSRDGVNLHYEIHGHGPAILLSHGYSATLQMWRGQIEPLSRHHQLILWDMRGHGQTDSPDDLAAYSEDATIGDMAALLDAAGAESAIVGGLSLGGYMSLAFHLAHPELVRALLLFDTGPGFKNDDARAAWNRRALETASTFETDGLASLQSRSREMAMSTHRSAAGLARAARGMLVQRDARVIKSLPNIRVPALVIVGAEDTPFLASADYMAVKIPNARKVVIPQAGHASNLDQPEMFNQSVVTFLESLQRQFVEEHIPELLAKEVPATGIPTVATAGDKQSLPLAVGPQGTIPVASVMQAIVVSIDVKAGDLVTEGQPIAVLEAMKMQHLVTTSKSGIVRHVNVCAGDMVFEEQALLFIEPAEASIHKAEEQRKIDLDHVRCDLAEVIERHAIGSDERRPEAVARRRKTGQRTARENIADLCDQGSFTEYGALAIAAQRRRRSLDDLIKNTPADGLVAGIGTVNGSTFPQVVSRCMVMAYDYTVLAGTQGRLNHKKMDHMIRLADQWRLPLVLFAEGGGGRPGDTDGLAGAHLDVITFHHFARLSGKVPLIGVVSGRCFAGNAALLGCCDVIIATENSSIGMAGPAMIEGGGLGVYEPDEVGPIPVQTRNGVVDIAVRDEVEGVQAAKKYLSFYQGSLTGTNTAVVDQRVLRTLIPENRLRVYDVRKVIEVLADTGWFLELRRDWAPGMITGFIRIEGCPLGLIANNPTHLAGAIDPDGADKAARFMQLCEGYGLPILSLCDTPGFMVGPEIEKRAQVRHTSRMFLTGANLTVPYIMVTLRKGYGLGAQAMAGGCFSTPLLHVSWPTGEFGPMGLEGAVKLGFRKELEAIQDPQARQDLFDEMLAKAYENGKAINVASFLEFDDVIDPAETRTYIVRALKSVPALDRSGGKRRPFIDAW